MKILGLGTVLLAACGACAPAARPEPLPDRSTTVDRRVRPEEIVALVDGEPVTWQAVAETVLELNLKDSVDQYVRWKIVEDRRRDLGIAHAPEELRRRAEVYLEQVKKQVGLERFRQELTREGATEEGKRAQLEGSRFLSQMLTLDKIVRYAELVEDHLELDRVYFAQESEARGFRAAALARGFDAAAQELAPQRSPSRGRLPREVFPRSRPPTVPLLDPSTVEKLARLSPGSLSEVESGRSKLYYVVRFLGIRKGRHAVYSDVRGEVLESILKDPPAQQDYARWMERELSAHRVEYRDGASRREHSQGPP